MASNSTRRESAAAALFHCWLLLLEGIAGHSRAHHATAISPGQPVQGFSPKPTDLGGSSPVQGSHRCTQPEFLHQQEIQLEPGWDGCCRETAAWLNEGRAYVQ